MLLGGGILIETVEARIKPLERILKHYVEKKFSGYIVYKNDAQGIYISIAMVDGSIVGCRFVGTGVVYEGVECCDAAMRYLYEPKGVIEVREAPRNIIVLDLVIFPLSRIESASALTSAVGAKVGIPIPEVVAPPIKAPELGPEAGAGMVPIAPTETMPEKPAEKPAPPPHQVPEAMATTTTATAKPVEKPAEIPVANECIDPVTLYMVMRSSQLLEVVPGSLGLWEVVEKVKGIVMEKKPSYVYVSGLMENVAMRMVYDANSKSIGIELERGGSIVCGDKALKELENKKISGIKIWYVA